MKTSILVQNIKCGGCAKTILNKLSEMDSISEITINIEENKVSFNPNTELDILLVKETLKSLGYPSFTDTNNITSKAKSLVSCALGKFTN
ncbi:heavy-metal-associated domain-containing protein [Siansivirga zeaxanthinifaciens]|uniref:Heavy metal transporter n=1 Tax=Siansivirga zeaxanthinifaciens CC-SAMT-1 TaxID=1454006 RepID=A0A0C5WGZ6_9FLAO|nr:heavy metal-associated domain-containing protein [Siansivirga zeaxanthinifaciens]AJR04424.1 heavy metal transporter [Siansivirga zeaxanthinifaciens CC-SAMT-1]